MKLIPSILLPTLLIASSTTSRADDAPKMGKDDGPYMVIACMFRGPEAELRAQTLANELRKDHDLPSFLLDSPDKGKFPGFSVLVGNCKSTREAFELCRRVKKIKPKCMETNALVTKGSGLSRAMLTTNPLVKLNQVD